MASEPKLSPGMRQYLDTKANYPHAILFFQMGDFYEIFFEDAVKAADLLGIALTSRSKKDDNPIPMCGVPISAGLDYANRLTEQGISVVVANQKGNKPDKATGVVERVVWQMGTPGLPLSTGDIANTGHSHYLAAIYPGPGGFGLAGLEASTGDLILAHLGDLESLRAELLTFAPHECLVPEKAGLEIFEILKDLQVYATRLPEANLNSQAALEQFNQRFGHHATCAWGLADWPEALAAAAGVLDYAKGCGQGDLEHLAPPRLLWREDRLILDEAALANLEILKSLRHGQTEGSLVGLMDRTATAMGSRLLKEWLSRPLGEISAISLRHQAVGELLSKAMARDSLSLLLKKSSDLERALGRVALKRGSPRDLGLVRDTLALVPYFAQNLGTLDSPALVGLGESLPDFTALSAQLESHLAEQPPLNTKEGGLIKRGISTELDELLDLEKGGKNSIAALEAKERENTGINSLKVGFNRVYGYYLEVTKTNLSLVPESWIRKQTIAGGERYFTPELKQMEEKISHAGERRVALEEQIFSELQSQVELAARPIKEAARILAEVDALCSLATCAEKYGWVRPELVEEDIIDIKGGRHPVVEALLPQGEVFVANDVLLDSQERLLIITGPNMAGKSTILRQVALIVLMSQAGSFVPADAARLSVRDRIFTRVGASDDLARGRSTFMVEMNETARILALATPRSLVVLDEVGRGTSTYDGLSLAWAIAEYLHDVGDQGVPTIFATHYHELIALAALKHRARNFNVAVRKEGRKITFMRQLKAGGVSRSYGLAVAAMAGLPKKVLERAKEVLNDFSKAGDKVVRPAVRQLGLFDETEVPLEPPLEPPLEHPLPQVVTNLAEIQTEELTPLAALNILNDLCLEARKLINGE